MKTQVQYIIVANISSVNFAKIKESIIQQLGHNDRYRFDTKGYIEATLVGNDNNELQAHARRVAVLLKPSLIKKSMIFTEEY